MAVFVWRFSFGGFRLAVGGLCLAVCVWVFIAGVLRAFCGRFAVVFEIVLRSFCGRFAGVLLAVCGRFAGGLRAECGRFAGGLRAECGRFAGGLRLAV